jgi:hypothetical protein
MNIRIILAATAVLSSPTFAQVATVKPPAQKIKWDEMDLGPFFSGTYKVKEATANKGVAVAVGTKETPATILFDTELLRFHAAWEGGLAAFARGRGGLEGTIKNDGDVHVSTRLSTGLGTEVKADPRPRNQGNLAETKWKGIHVNGPHTILSYSVGKQSVLELPGSSVVDGRREFTRTLSISAGSDIRQILVAEGNGQVNADGSATLTSDGKASGFVLRGAPQGSKLVLKDGRLVAELAAISSPATLQIAFATVDAADAAALKLKTDAVLPNLSSLVKPGPGRWGDALVTTGKLGEEKGGYASDEITLPEDNPYKSWLRPGGHDFFPDGTCALVNMSGDIWLVSGLDEKLEAVKWKRFAAGLFQPLGAKVVDGKIYVVGRDQITRLHDLNNDGEADFYENFNNDCVVVDNYHEFALDLQTDKAGNFYYAKGSPWTPTNQTPHQGTMLRVSKDGSKLEVFATGLRAPNGLGMGPNDELTCSDNQGHWMPANRLNLVKPGGFYGMVPAAHKVLTFKKADGTEYKANPSLQSARDEFKTEFWGKKDSPEPLEGQDLPLVWLPMNVDNSPGGEVWAPKGWGAWGGHMLHMSYGKCILYGVTMETVDGQQQGSVTALPVKFRSGIQRGRFSPKDGQLYLTGLSVWQSSAAKDGCFHRVRATGKVGTYPTGFTTKANGVEVTFNAPIDPASAGDLQNWNVEQWNYRWSGAYGSPDVSALNPAKTGKDPVAITKVTVSADKKSVMLELADRMPVMQMKVKCNIKAADGSDVQHDTYATLNKLPAK